MIKPQLDEARQRLMAARRVEAINNPVGVAARCAWRAVVPSIFAAVGASLVVLLLALPNGPVAGLLHQLLPNDSSVALAFSILQYLLLVMVASLYALPLGIFLVMFVRGWIYLRDPAAWDTTD